MSGSQTNEVDTFGPRGCLSVRLPNPCKAGKMKAAVGEKLGLKPASLPLFGLFEGLLGAQCSVLEDDGKVPPQAKLCFQRWGDLALDKETKLCRQDDVANRLLYAEARFDVDRGKIVPSAEQLEVLQGLSDPSFPAERQYLELVQTLPGYHSQVARGVVVKGNIISNDIQIPDGTTVTCLLTRERLALMVGEGEESSWRWEMVKRWQTRSAQSLQYEVCMMQGNAPILSWLHLHTPQAYYLRAVSEMYCHHLKAQLDRIAPQANPRMAGKPFNPLTDFLNSELFRFNKFSSVEK